MSKIFLSHAATDNRLVPEFIKFLKLGFDISGKDIFSTSETDSIQSGAQYVDVIRENLISSRAIIMLISKNYLNSPFCLCELGAAWALDHLIKIPILVNVDFQSVVYPNTPYRSSQLRKISEENHILTVFQELSNHKIIDNPSIPSFIEQLKEFLAKKVWLRPDGNLNTGLLRRDLTPTQRPKLSPMLKIDPNNPFPRISPPQRPK